LIVHNGHDGISFVESTNFKFWDGISFVESTNFKFWDVVSFKELTNFKFWPKIWVWPGCLHHAAFEAMPIQLIFEAIQLIFEAIQF